MNKLYKNEQRFAELNRHLNEQTARLAPEDFPQDFVMDLYCECANKACFERFNIAFGEYRRVKNNQTFVVKPEHYLPEFENLEKQTPHYWIIVKRPEKLEKQFDV